MGIYGLDSPANALALTLRIAAVGVAISSAEMLSQPRDLLPGGLLAGRITLSRSPWLRWACLRAILLSLLGSKTAFAVVTVRLLAAILLAADPNNTQVERFATLAVTLAILLLKIRSPYGTHASGAMTQTVFIAASLALLVGTRTGMSVALWFIAGQAWLAYFVAGSMKLRDPRWPRGQALAAITSTTMWGGRQVALLLRSHRRAGFVLCWMTMAGECSIPLTLAAPLPVSLALLACALFFHIATAVEMGLNAFVWAFAATYPAIIFCWYAVHGLHGWGA